MKLKNMYTAAVLILFGAMLFTSCDDENMDNLILTPVFDCEELELNFADSCLVDTIVGIVDENCLCQPSPGPTVQCPTLNLNIGEPCIDTTVTNIVNGLVSDDCECIELPDMFDCPDQMLNYNDSCTVNNTTGIIDTLCNCIVLFDFDCPDIMQNVGDTCIINSTGAFGIVDANCICN